MTYLLPFILAMVVTMAWLPVLAHYAGKWLFLDQPGARKVHATPTPRVGGLAMACGVLVAALLTIHLQPSDRWFLAAAGVLVLFGAADDRLDLDYKIKLLGQVLAVGIVVSLGDVHIRTFTMDDRVALPEWVSLPLTVLFLIGITNAINLADGLDGLAGGTTFLCLCAVALLSGAGDSGSAAALALAFAGAVLGFLRFNTYPASVFMGDAGSQVLGFTIGVLSVRATQSPSSQLSAALPVLLLALPILDTLSVMVQRIGEGRSPFSPDKNHIHHKLLALGFDHHEAVMVIYALQAALFVVAYLLRYESDLLILGAVVAFFGVTITLFQIASRHGWRLRAAHSVAPHAAIDGPNLGTWVLPHLLQKVSYVALSAALAAYGLVVGIETMTVSSDIWILVVVLLLIVSGCLMFAHSAPLRVVEKAVLFVTATIFVYLDAVLSSTDAWLTLLGWTAVGITAIAAAVRLRLFNDRRFQFTPLDLIVLFMALVVPSLLGSLRLPHGGALGIAKLVVLLYGIEILVNRPGVRAIWVRIAVFGALAGLALRTATSV
jgi:UDP-GlcNAc:undecaprenyl-phosphate GlcNAc-1-phosphate transferase